MTSLRLPLGQRGLTLLELIITLAILAVLASAVLPMAEVTVKRNKEIELRQALRTMRTAIDDYKADFDKAVAEGRYQATIGESGYPEDLDTLVKGKDWGGVQSQKRKYLRRIPKDPFDENDEGWGLRAYDDDHDSTVWGGKNVYDVYSQSQGTGLDGTPYRDW